MSATYPLRPALDLLEERGCDEMLGALGVDVSTYESWIRAGGLTESEADVLAERLGTSVASLWPEVSRMSPAEAIAAARASLSRARGADR